MAAPGGEGELQAPLLVQSDEGGAAAGLARKKLGRRYAMNVVPINPRVVRGSHGRLPDDPADGPVLLCSDPSVARGRLDATEVRDLILDLIAIRERSRSPRSVG